MREPDSILGRIAAGLILELDMQVRSIVSTRQEWEVWAELCDKIDWSRAAFGAMQDLNANIAYAVQESKKQFLVPSHNPADGDER